MTNAPQQRSTTLLGMGAVSLLAVGLASWLWSDPALPAPAPRPARPADTDASGTVHRTELAAPTSSPRQGADVEPAPAVGAANLPTPGFLPLTIRVVGPAELVGQVPVAVVWSVDPSTRRALESTLVTNAAGLATAEVRELVQRPPWFWADFGFPTFGRVARAIPTDCGEVELAAILSQRLLVHVVEAGDQALAEAASVRVQATASPSPADRWHDVRLHEGLATTWAEVGGLALQIQVETASGRSTSTTVTTGDDPTVPLLAKVVLPAATGPRVRLVLADGTPVANTPVTVRRADSFASLTRQPLQTDGEGRLRLSLATAAWRRQPVLPLTLVTSRGERPHRGSLTLPAPSEEAVDAGDLLMLPMPRLVGGRVIQAGDVPAPGQRVVLQAHVVLTDKGGAAGSGSWQDVGDAVSAADGTFTIYAEPAPECSLRLRLDRDQAASVPWVRGDGDVELTVPRRYFPFGSRR